MVFQWLYDLMGALNPFGHARDENEEVVAEGARNPFGHVGHGYGGIAESCTDYQRRNSKLPLEYHKIILDLRDELQKSGTISRVEYVGSAFKKTLITDSDMDNLFIKRDFSMNTVDSSSHGGYAFLENHYGQQINPRTTLNDFKSKVQRALNALGHSNKILADHGPALELRVSEGSLVFNIDLVFCYEISKEKMYIAKPPKYATGKDMALWKYSTALEEKAYMSIIDKDNQVSRWAVRIIKALIKKEPTLQVITSYVVEQALYHLRDDYPQSFWKEPNLKEIIRILLTYTASAIENMELRNIFNHSENVIPYMSSVTRRNVVNRMRHLAKDPLLQRVMDTV